MTLPNQRLLWGAIASCEAIGAGTIRRFQKHQLDAETVWNASPKSLRDIHVGEAGVRKFCQFREQFDFTQFEEQLAQDAIRIVLRNDKDYPISLTTIHDPPEVLFVRGNLPNTNTCIAVVGTRKPSEYGLQSLKRLIAPVIHAGIPIISGMALGTDAFAHELALEMNGYTCAVLGSGIDDASLYPPRNRPLGQRIIQGGGGLVSEFPPGTKPRREYFPIRNRIIAGLVRAVVVIEAALDSGTLITAGIANENGREVLAVPGSIWSDLSAGTHKLIQTGSRLCRDAQDIFDALALDRVETCAKTQESLPLTPDERSLFEELRVPQTADELVHSTDWSIGRVQQALSLLELKQLAIRLESQLWGRI